MEDRQLAQCYLEKVQNAATLEERMKYEVFADGLLRPVEAILNTTDSSERIDSFHNTFLSNFYAVPVTYQGETYPTVEHAY